MTVPAGDRLPDAPVSPLFVSLHARIRELVGQVDAVATRDAARISADERDVLKQEILTVFREAATVAAEAQHYKEIVKALADRWKALGIEREPRLPTPVATPAVAPPMLPAEIGPDTGLHHTPSGGISRLDYLGASTFIEKGWSRLSADEAPAAELALRRALTLVPAHDEAESLLGWSLVLQGRLMEARAAANAVLGRHPSYALAHLVLGAAAMRQPAHDEAEARLEETIRLEGDHKATLYAHVYLGMVRREQRRFEEAELLLLNALELGPNCLQAWYELGWSRWRQGRAAEARDAWQSGAEANKFSPWGKRCSETVAVLDLTGVPG